MYYLSHILTDKTPAYGGDVEGAFKVKKVRSILEGHSCNAEQWSFSNHIGTHVDVPYHFFENGRKITDFPASFWLFEEI